MISVTEAEQIILSCRRDYGTERVPFQSALGRVLAQEICTDRDLPPYDRITMDGIAIRWADYAAGQRFFQITATQAAGHQPHPRPLPQREGRPDVHRDVATGCFASPPVGGGVGGGVDGHPSFAIEVMTGAVLPPDLDTVIPYERLSIVDGIAEVLDGPPLRMGQNIHRRGTDRQQGETVVQPGRRIGPAEIAVAASVGLADLWVKKLPRVAVLSSGDELVDVADTPLPYQIRRSNSYVLQAELRGWGIEAALFHLPDNLEIVRREVTRCQSEFDVLLLSGGVSMGKFDYIPQALEDCGTVRHFHKVRQRPGKPFWFGSFGAQGVVFALPGNPVSTFLCFHRYVLPWLAASLGLPTEAPVVAALAREWHFEPPLTYFLQVKLEHDRTGLLRALPVEGKGSGDFANLPEADAFLELPAERTVFQAGEVFPVIAFR